MQKRVRFRFKNIRKGAQEIPTKLVVSIIKSEIMRLLKNLILSFVLLVVVIDNSVAQETDEVARNTASFSTESKIVGLKIEYGDGDSYESLISNFETLFPALKAIYHRRLRSDISLEGEMTVKFGFDVNGKILESSIFKSTLNNTSFEDIIIKRIQLESFSVTKPTGIYITFKFSPI